jgi:hypothetical protein
MAQPVGFGIGGPSEWQNDFVKGRVGLVLHRLGTKTKTPGASDYHRAQTRFGRGIISGFGTNA